MTQCYNIGDREQVVEEGVVYIRVSEDKWWRRVLFIYEGVDGYD